MDKAPPVEPLVYVRDSMPGWRRLRRGDGFTCVDAEGRVLRDARALRRVRALAIPPAWEDVWICPLAHGHLQATGRDARGRKQYRYHPQWQAQQGQTKFERLQAFGRALPALRRRVRRDLARRGLPRERLLALLVRLLDTTYLRVGNDEYARHNGSYGLTTLRSRHAAVRGSVLRLAFRGKSGVAQRVEVADPRLVRIVRRCQALPGQELFQYLGDDGAPHRVDSADVNAYLRSACGDDFSAKDFRTWHASVLALEHLLAEPPPDTRRDAAARVKAAIAEVARQLGHSVAVCRRDYVHAAVLEHYTAGRLDALADAGAGAHGAGLRRGERRLLALLDGAGTVGARFSSDRPSVPEGTPGARS